MKQKTYRIFINENFFEKRIAVCTRQHLDEILIDRGRELAHVVGNIYVGLVDRVLPGMQAAFVDIGLSKNGFLYGGDLASEEDDLDYLDDDGPSGSDSVSTPHLESLKPNSPVIVQVTKAPVGSKGPRLTNNISIPGKFLVLMPQNRRIGISKKITDHKVRNALHKAIREIRAKNDVSCGIIIRTAAASIQSAKIKHEYLRLCGIWRNILDQRRKAKPPALLYSDNDVLDRVLREYCANPKTQVIVDSRSVFDSLIEKARDQYFFPTRNISLYTKRTPLFDDFGIEQELNRAMDRRVWLKSGSYLIFDETEALTVIDVNTGRFVGKKHLEDTLTQTNLVAAEEIVHQIILRNISGIIIVDFIDMDNPKNRNQIIDTLKKLLKEDKMRNSVLAMTQLGLVQITRKRTAPSIRHQLTITCPYCDGTGRIKSHETVILDILRAIKYRQQTGKRKINYSVFVSESIHEAVKSTYSEMLKFIQKEHKFRISWKTKDGFHQEEYELI